MRRNNELYPLPSFEVSGISFSSDLEYLGLSLSLFEIAGEFVFVLGLVALVRSFWLIWLYLVV